MLQNPQERSQAEQALKVFGLSPDYITHCKVCILSLLLLNIVAVKSDYRSCVL